MMTKPNSRFSLVKKVFAVPAIFALAILFVQKTYASESGNTLGITSEIKNSVSQSSSENPYQDFLKLLEKYNLLLENRKFDDFSKQLTEEDKIKFGKLWEQLNNDERNTLPIFLMSEKIIHKKRVPTIVQLADFKNSKNYGVWIDSKKVQNSTLNKYKTTDFSNVFISKVYKNARNAKNPQPFQVTLMTNDYFEKLNDENSKKNGYIVGVVSTFYNRTKSDTIRKPLSKEVPTKKQSEIITDYSISPPVSKDSKLAEEDSKYIINQTNIAPPKSIYKDIDVLPEFPGGVNVLRNKISTNFNGAVLKGDEGTLKTEVYFVIDKDGKVSNVEAFGTNDIFDNEAVRSTKSANENQTWKPAMKDGKPVRYRFRMPLTMSFGDSTENK